MTIQGPEGATKPQYFKDPALDALYQMVLVLGEEMAAMREQVHAISAVHAEGGVPTTDVLNDYDPGPQYEEMRRQFAERLLTPLQDLIDREIAD